MPLANTSILRPDAVSSRAPLKKSTVGWIVAVIVVLAAVGVAAPALIQSSDEPVPAKVPDKDVPVQAGRPQAIDSEFEQARRQREREVAEQARRAASSTVTVQPPLPGSVIAAGAAESERNPVPADARRKNSDAAFYDRPGSKSGTASPGGSDQEFEIDSAARTSKSLAIDDGSLSNEKPKDPVEDRMRALLPPSSPMPSNGNEASLPGGMSALDALVRAQTATPAGASHGDRGWLKELAAEKTGAQNKPLKPYLVSSPYTLLQGKVMPAVLMRDINTDLPGRLNACLTLDVYDSISSNYLLMPRGTCLVGEYSSSIRPGQKRVLFAFNRIILPNGLSFDLPAAPGADLGGAAGVEGAVNNHFFRMFTSSFLVAWLADRAERNAPAGTNIGASGGAKTAAGQVLVDTSRSILERDKTLAPTITVTKGALINIEVTQDMEFPGPYRK